MLSLTSMSSSSLIGVAIACGGNVLISLALTVQKLAHRRQNEELAASRSASSSGKSTPTSADTEDPLTGSNGSDGVKNKKDTIDVPVLLVDDTAISGSSSKRGSGSQRGQSGTPIQVDSIHLERTISNGLDSVPEDAVSEGRSVSSIPAKIKVPKGYSTILRIKPSQNGRTGNHSQSEGSEDRKDGDQKQEVEEGAYLKSKLWWLGMCLIAVGEGGNFLSYGFAPASVVAPLGTVALIANCVFAPLILRETFHAKELIGMALAILGAVTVVWSSNASNPRLDPNGLIQAIIQIPFIVYTSINLALAILLVIFSQSQRFGGKYIAIDIGVCALFGGYTVLSTKALSSLLSTIFLDALKYWITWALLLVLVVTSILQVKYLNRALMRFQSKEVIPTQFVFFSLAAIIGSAVLYQEFRDVSMSQIINFAFGIATTFLGVHLLTSFSEPDPSEGDNDGQNRPSGPERAMSSASLNLLLPSTSRLSERTPLLIPVSAISEPGPLQTPIGSINPGSSPLKGRLLKRTSTSDFAPTLSQAGFLLMATTPPRVNTIGGGRERSLSRSRGPIVGDEERGGGGRDRSRDRGERPSSVKDGRKGNSTA